MLVNAFNILDQEMNSIGTGIYLGVSITDHCCNPNAVATFEGTVISIRMIEEIPALDWSKVKYISHYSKTLNNLFVSDLYIVR